MGVSFPILLLFKIKYKVPWICKWDYSVIPKIVIRQYNVMWWPRFDHNRIIAQVEKEFPVKVPTQVKITGTTTSTPAK